MVAIRWGPFLVLAAGKPTPDVLASFFDDRIDRNAPDSARNSPDTPEVEAWLDPCP